MMIICIANKNAARIKNISPIPIARLPAMLKRYNPNKAIAMPTQTFKGIFLPNKSVMIGTNNTYSVVRKPAFATGTVNIAICCTILPMDKARPHKPEPNHSFFFSSFGLGRMTCVRFLSRIGMIARSEKPAIKKRIVENVHGPI